MPYLALAVADDSGLGDSAGMIAIDRGIWTSVTRELGARVLLYRRTEQGRLDYFASGRVAAIRAPEAGGRQCEFDSMVWFDEPILDESENDNLAARRGLNLSVERFTQIVDNGGVSRLSVEEANGLDLDRRLPEGFADIVRDEVIARWGYRCAITGHEFDDQQGLRLVPIRALARGGSIEPSNYLPMVEAAERAWRRGALAVTSDGSLVLNADKVDDQLASAVQRQRKLVLPRRPDHQPDRASLAWHFSNVFGRS